MNPILGVIDLVRTQFFHIFLLFFASKGERRFYFRNFVYLLNGCLLI